MNNPGVASPFKAPVQELLQSADIQIEGSRPWDIQVTNIGFYGRVIRELALGLGESYMDGWWDCEHLDQFFYRLLSANLQEKAGKNKKMIAFNLLSRLTNLQTPPRLRKSVGVSYERGVELYAAFLDPFYQYSCAYFKNTDDLATAQKQKMDLICRKLRLEASDQVLDIGCGWGGLAKFIAEKVGCKVTGINIAQEQIAFARDFCRGTNVEILELDYRNLLQEEFQKKFNKIVSVGMIEHVGYKNHRVYMQAVNNCLKHDGMFLLQTIGSNISAKAADKNLWIEKYIFPNAIVPSIPQLASASEGLFIIDDIHSFGSYYDLTLMAWANNFENNWANLRSHYDERFHRMWRYFLLSCAGAMRAGYNQLWQIVFRKIGTQGLYEPER
ncbi:MAG: cyclopropane fatty acyl phospholipid synthase [Bacteroidota bacterium]